MRSRLWVLLLILALSSTAAAQIRNLELFGGYSLEGAVAPDNRISTYHGWNASTALPIWKRFSITADFGGHYGNPTEVVNLRVHTFLFGPQYRLRRGRLSPYVHGLLGVSRQSADAGGPAYTENSFALAVGGGLDLRMSRGVSIRFVQVDYLRRSCFGVSPDNLRFSFGVIYKLGRE